MKRYFIYAYDNLYQGLHGMYDWIIYEGPFKEACKTGQEMSRDVIEAYSCIYDELTDGLEEEDFEDEIYNDIAYEIYELKENAPTDDEIYNLNWDPRDIIDEYCVLGEDYD